MADTLESRLTKLANQFAAQVAHEVRQSLAAQMSSLLVGGTAPKRRGRPPGPHNLVAAASSSTPKVKRNYPKHCIAPGCTKKHGGPRSGFFCLEHDSLPKSQKEAAKAAYKASK